MNQYLFPYWGLFMFLIFTITNNATIYTSIQWDNLIISNYSIYLLIENKYTNTFKLFKTVHGT